MSHLDIELSATRHQALDEKAQYEYEEKPTDILHDGQELKSEYDSLTVLQTLRTFWKPILFSTLIGITALSDGYIGQIHGVALANPGFVKQFGTVVGPDGAVALAPSIVSIWGGCNSAAQILTSMTCSMISDRFGRKMTFYFVWICAAISVATFQAAKTWEVFLVSQIFGGLALGAGNSLAPSYICEFTPSKARGIVLLSYYICNSLGLLLGPVVYQILSQSGQPENYILLVYTQWPVLAYMAFAYLFVPESPWFYLMHGKTDRARAVLQRVNGGIKGYDVEENLRVIRNTLEEEHQNNHYESFGDLVRSYKQALSGVNGRRYVAATLPLMGCLLSGVYLFGNYSAYFFSLAGFTNGFLVQTLIFGTTCATQCVTAFIVEFTGRRRLVLAGAIVDMICCAIIGLIGSLGKTLQLQNFVIGVTMIWAVFNTFLGTLGGSYTAEAPSSKFRTRTAGLAQGSVNLIGLVMSFSIPFMINPPANLGLQSGWVFAGLLLPLVPAVYFFVPDLSGRSPAEQDELWENGTPPRKFHKTTTKVQIDFKARQDARKAVGQQGIATA